MKHAVTELVENTVLIGCKEHRNSMRSRVQREGDAVPRLLHAHTKSTRSVRSCLSVLHKFVVHEKSLTRLLLKCLGVLFRKALTSV